MELMFIATTTTPSPSPGAAPTSTRDRAHAQRDRRSADALVFEQVLGGISLPALKKDAASPAQMFEPRTPKGGHPRQTPQADPGAPRQLHDLDPPGADRSSIDARRAAAEAAGNNRAAAQPARATATMPHANPAALAQPRNTAPASQPPVDATLSRIGNPTQTTLPSPQPSASPTQHNGTTPPGLDHAPTTPTPRAAGLSPGERTNTTPPSPPTAQPARTPAAQQIGRLLGAAKLGEAQSARSATPPATPAEARPPGSAPTSSPPRTTAQPGESSQSQPARTPGSETRVAETGRTMFDQLVRSIRLHSAGERSLARMQLVPPELGRVSIDLRIDGDTLRINVRTETDAARDLIAGRADRLTAALEEHGIRIHQLNVATEPHEPDASNKTTNTATQDDPYNDLAGRSDPRTEHTMDDGLASSRSHSHAERSEVSSPNGTTDESVDPDVDPVNVNTGTARPIASETRLDVRA